MSNFNKLKYDDKIKIFNKFAETLYDNTNNVGLYFIMTNGERSITFKNEYMKFKITEELKN